MNTASRVVLLFALTVSVYLLSLGYISVVHNSFFIVVSGSEGETTSKVFTVFKSDWRISLDYFRAETIGWSFNIQVFAAENSEVPVYYASAVRYVYADGREGAELPIQPGLPAGDYYLKISSTNVQWTVRVID